MARFQKPSKLFIPSRKYTDRGYQTKTSEGYPWTSPTHIMGPSKLNAPSSAPLPYIIRVTIDKIPSSFLGNRKLPVSLPCHPRIRDNLITSCIIINQSYSSSHAGDPLPSSETYKKRPPHTLHLTDLTSTDSPPCYYKVNSMVLGELQRPSHAAFAWH